MFAAHPTRNNRQQCDEAGIPITKALLETGQKAVY